MADARVEQRHRDEAREHYDRIYGYCITDKWADEQNRSRFAQALANAEQRGRDEGMERAVEIATEAARTHGTYYHASDYSDVAAYHRGKAAEQIIGAIRAERWPEGEAPDPTGAGGAQHAEVAERSPLAGDSVAETSAPSAPRTVPWERFAEAIRALRHALYRNHDIARWCAGCQMVDRVLSTPEAKEVP